MTIPASVNIMPERPIAEVVELAALAERRGYRRCWVYDEGLATRDVYVTLAAIAARTGSIRLGPGITNPYVRHPGATAHRHSHPRRDERGPGLPRLGRGRRADPRPLGPRAAPAGGGGAGDGDRSAAAVRGRDGDHRTRQPGLLPGGPALGYGRDGIEIILAGRGPKMTALGAEIADGFHPQLRPQGADRRGDRRVEGGRGRPLGSALPDHVLHPGGHRRRRAGGEPPSVVLPALGLPAESAADDRHDRRRRRRHSGGADCGGGRPRPPPLGERGVGGPFLRGRLAAGGGGRAASAHGRHGIDEFQVSVLGGDGAAERIEGIAALFG